jgi:hypothetical protein
VPPPIPVNVGGTTLPYQFHQVAMFLPPYVHMEEAKRIYNLLGFHNWMEDRAILRGHYRDPRSDGRRAEVWQASEVPAWMQFNYDAMPMELEFLKYGNGLHRHLGRVHDKKPFISHMSTYVDDVIEGIERMRAAGFNLPYHRFVTQAHTNPHVVGKKRFIETIFATDHLIGYDLKLIQKVPWDYDDAQYLNHSIWS